jgi:hypothetical protein
MINHKFQEQNIRNHFISSNHNQKHNTVSISSQVPLKSTSQEFCGCKYHSTPQINSLNCSVFEQQQYCVGCLRNDGSPVTPQIQMNL